MPFSDYDDKDAEMQGKRRGSRLGGPLKSSTNPAAMVDSDGESALDVAKQMEMEAGNAIKYRTCSWQKVRLSCVVERSQPEQHLPSNRPDGHDRDLPSPPCDSSTFV